MLTRLTLPSPSIWPPERKNTSMRPWPAQSNNSRAAVGEERVLAAAAAATRKAGRCRRARAPAAPRSPGSARHCRPRHGARRRSGRAITSASSSSSRKSGRAAFIHILVRDIRRSLPRVAAMRGVFARDARRPRRNDPASGSGQAPRSATAIALDIEAGQRAGGERRIVEQIAVVDLLDRRRWCAPPHAPWSTSSRWRPIQTLPSRSAIGAWNSATSGLIAGSSTIGSSLPNGLSITFQSGRYFSTSEPISPRSGMNGTPFSAACNAACSAGQVASFMRIVPAEDRGGEARRRRRTRRG